MYNCTLDLNKMKSKNVIWDRRTFEMFKLPSWPYQTFEAYVATLTIEEQKEALC